ncbi:GpE family phage tail protein [Sphingomonas ursincola]|uniref:GpE family phage tail protein n=1 Tax=Sphingomonas ursincola TaxID=56361 RepID=A0A7V8U7N7_9SPHN|nr:GpE family phage tail protein [Sphingomonas ursincola]
MADIAAIFHWPLSELEALEFEELIYWRSKAVDRWNRMHCGKD